MDEVIKINEDELNKTQEYSFESEERSRKSDYNTQGNGRTIDEILRENNHMRFKERQETVSGIYIHGADEDSSFEESEKVTKKQKDLKTPQKDFTSTVSILRNRLDDYENLTRSQKSNVKSRLKKYENDSKDYSTFGLGFDLAHTKVHPTDTGYMRKVKDALYDYLTIRKEVFENHDLREMSAQDLAWNNGVFDSAKNKYQNGEASDKKKKDAKGFDSRDVLTEEEREALGKALDKLYANVNSYLFYTNKYLNVARGRARYRQVERVKEQLIRDDARFYLFQTKRATVNSVDNSYRRAKTDGVRRDFADRFVNSVMPTWQKGLYWSDKVDLERYAYRERRREERAQGKLPGFFKRSLQWAGSFFKIRGYKMAMGYNNIGGLVDRTLGTATMLAANTVELGGKIIKLPLKILSGIVNLGSWVMFKKKVWKMKYSLRDNWKSVDDGRKIFRRYLKGACVLPTAVLESLTRGIPALFGHKFQSGVYKRTTRWSRDILEDAKNVMRSVGIPLEEKKNYRNITDDPRESIGEEKEEEKEKDAEQTSYEEKYDRSFIENDEDSYTENDEAGNTEREEDRYTESDEDSILIKKTGKKTKEPEEKEHERELQEDEKEELQEQEKKPEEVKQEPQPEPMVRPKVEVQTLFNLFPKAGRELLYTKDMTTLTAPQLTDLKAICVNVLSRQTGIEPAKLDWVPLEIIQIMAKQADEDYPNTELLKSNVENSLKTLEELLTSKERRDFLREFPDKTAEEEKLPEFTLLSMKEYALLVLKKNPGVKLSDDKALEELSPEKLVELAENAVYYTDHYRDGVDAETAEKLRHAATTVLALTTGLPETKFMMRPMEELNTLVQKAFSGLDDRKTLAQETLDFLEKIPEFDVETEVLNDREAELLKRDYAEASPEELLRLKNISERVLLKKAGVLKNEADFLPLDLKVELAREVFDSKAGKEELKSLAGTRIDAFLKTHTLEEIRNTIEAEYDKEDAGELTEAEQNAKRDFYAMAIAKAGMAGEARRKDFDRVPMEELKEAADFAVMIAKTTPAELEEAELKDYRDSLCVFLEGYTGLQKAALSLYTTSMLTDYAKDIITGMTTANRERENRIPRAPMPEDTIQLRLNELTKDLFGKKEKDKERDRAALVAFLEKYAGAKAEELSELSMEKLEEKGKGIILELEKEKKKAKYEALPKGHMTENYEKMYAGTKTAGMEADKEEPLTEEELKSKLEHLSIDALTKKEFDTLQAKTATLELKELIAYHICRETGADRDALMTLDADSLYRLYTSGSWRKKAKDNEADREEKKLELQGLADLQREQAYGSFLSTHGVAQLGITTEWSAQGQKLLNFLSDLVSGIGATDEFGVALSKGSLALEVFRKNADMIAILAKGKKNPFLEILNGIAEDEALLFQGLQTVVTSVTQKLSELKEANEELKEEEWSAEVVRTLLNTKEGAALLENTDDQIVEAMEKEGRKVQSLIAEATKDIFVSTGKTEEKNENVIREKKEQEQEKEEETEAFEEEIPNLIDLDQGYFMNQDLIRSQKEYEENKIGKKEEESESARKLHQMRDAAYGEGSVQGRFLQASLKGYYEKASHKSKRLILSEVLRNMKPMRRFQNGPQKQRNAAYFESVLKGAGPVMQKLMQGVPEKLIKQEFRRAMQVAKSELRHLPEAYVKAKLDEIAKTSKKPVESMTKLSELGAASVAETFLCEVRYTDGTREKVVVKILRPDAEERMQEERKIMTDIANETDPTGVMEGAILSHITEIGKEFDFRTEFANTEKGKVYETSSLQNGTVKSVKVNKNFETKKDVFVMDKAEGESGDRYLAQVREEIERNLSLLKNKGEGDPDLLVITANNAKDWMKVKNNLVRALKKLERRKKHIVKLSEKWVQEALFGKHFHHGDLHSGNLMIDDNGVTVLDYGNANVFTEDQVTYIVRLMASALFGKVELFTQNLEELINLGRKEKKPIPQKQRDALKKSLREVFSLGEKENAGERIFVALQKAEEAGIRLPHAIQNFSRCEQRLENTIDEFNTVTEELQRAIKRVNLAEGDNKSRVDLHPVLSLQRGKQRKTISLGKDAIANHIGDYKKLDEQTLREDYQNLSREEFEARYLSKVMDNYNNLIKDKAQAAFKMLPKSVEALQKLIDETLAEKDLIMRSAKSTQITIKVNKLVDNLGCPEIMPANAAREIGRAVNLGNAEKAKWILSFFSEAERLMRMVHAYKEAHSITTVFKKKYKQSFIRDYLAFSERSKEAAAPMAELRSTISSDTESDIDYIADYNSLFFSLRSRIPHLLRKDERGDFVLGEPTKELDAVWNTLLKTKIGTKGYAPATEEEKAAGEELRRLSFYIGELEHIWTRDKMVEEQLAEVLNSNTDFGKKFRKTWETFKKKRKVHLDARGKKNPDENEIQRLGKERKKAEEEFLLMYREYLTEELEKLRLEEEAEPEVEDINFAGVMKERVMNNRFATKNYLGGIKKAFEYMGDDLEKDLTEEEKKQLGIKTRQEGGKKKK